MASLVVLTAPASCIDYSMNTGEVRAFELRGEVLYDKKRGICVDGWKEKLVDWVKECELDKPNEFGLRAFVWWLHDEGLMEYNSQHGST